MTVIAAKAVTSSPSSLLRNMSSSRLNDQTAIDKVSTSVQNLTGGNLDVMSMTSGNHWYTKDSLAVFIFPKHQHLVVKHTLMNTYLSSGCEYDISLALRRDGTYAFVGDDLEIVPSNKREGSWLFRAYPYIELISKGPLPIHHYFEINKREERDQIGKISLLTLSSLNDNEDIGSCAFIFGTRH